MHGFNKKGKQFYSFDTNLAEGITSLHVRDNSIWLTGDYTFTQLVDHVEAQFYIAPDHITDSDVSLQVLAMSWHAAAIMRASVNTHMSA